MAQARPLAIHKICLGIAVSFCLLLTACSGGSITNDAIVMPGEVDSTLSGPNSPIVEDTPAVWEPGPLDSVMARVWGGSWGDTTEPLTRQQAVSERERELLDELYEIAACMAEQGFEYIPTLSGMTFSITAEFADSEARMAQGTRAFAETFGFGISTEIPSDTVTVSHIELPNPNDEIRSQMSEAELAAQLEAFVGDGSGESGCVFEVQAARQARTDPPDEFSGLAAEVMNFWLTLDDDPKFSAIDANWAACMLDAGHPGFSSPLDAQTTLWQEWFDLRTTPEGSLRFPGVEAATAFTEREVEVALASWQCRMAVNYDAEHRAVVVELQQQFVDRHGSELEAWAQVEEARRA